MFAPLADARSMTVSSGRGRVPIRYWTWKKVMWRKLNLLTAAAFSKTREEENVLGLIRVVSKQLIYMLHISMH